MRQLALFLFLVLNIAAYSQTPTVAASNIKFTFTGCNEINIEWTNGNGSDRVVFMQEGNAVDDYPEYNTFYTDNPIFGKGEDIKGDKKNWCVYRGPDNKVTVKGLKNITKYCIAVFEYNGGGGIYDYKTDAFPSACVTTKSIIAGFTKDTGRCLNENVIKYTNTSTSDLTPMTYTWKFADGDSLFSKDPSHSYKTPGIKPVKLIVKSPGCYSTITLYDSIRPHPVAKFLLDKFKANNDSIQCYFGNRFTFQNKTTLLDIGDGPSSMRYEWYENNDTGKFSDGYKADRKFPSPGVKTVKLVVISNRGCMDSTYMTYKVLPRAIDPSKVIFSDKSRCLSDAKFTFTNNSPNSLQPSKWYVRDTLSTKYDDSVFGQTASYKFTKTGKKYVYLRVYDAAGCLDELKDSVFVFNNTSVKFTGLLPEYCLNSAPSKLTPSPGKGIFTGTNVGNIDTSGIFNPAAVGTYTVYFEYSKGNCKDSFTQITTVLDRPNIYLGKDTAICKDSPMQINLTPASLSNIYWTHNGNKFSTSASVTITESGLYKVIAYEGKCSDTDEISIKSLGTPSLKSSRDTTLCGGSYLVFNLKVDDGSVVWNDGYSGKDRNLGQTGFYKVDVSNKCGTVSDSFNLTVEESACKIFFPNAFTPNGDVLNDTWQPYGKFEFIRMNIFNRWGEQVYFSDKSPVWNGYTDKNLCLDGVYSCVFEYLIQDGNSMKKITEGIIIHLVR